MKPGLPTPETFPKILQRLLEAAAVGLVYFAAGKLGLRLAFVNASASAFWPPSGIALIAFLLLGNRIWPAVFVGAFLTNVTTAGSAATSLVIAAGNTLEGLLGAFLIQRFAHGRKVFDSPMDIFKFVFLAGMLSTMASATIGVTSLALGGFAAWKSYGPVWLTWWLGDATGDLIFAPLLLLWITDRRIGWQPRRILEGLLLVSILLGIGLLVFRGYTPFENKNYPLEFLCIPPLIWVAFKFGKREAAAAVFVLSLLAVTGTLHGMGPFAGKSQNASLLLLQIFMAVVSIMALSLAAVVSELHQANEELEKSNTMKSAFVSLVSHELRTPLASIKAGIDVLMEGIDGPVNESQSETLGIVKNNVDRLARLINNVLDYTKLEGGKMELRFERTSLSALLSEIHRFMKPVVEKKNIAFTLALPAKPVEAFCDADKMREVLINLVDNAYKYTGQGGRISLKLSSDGRAVWIDVEDTGVGIKEEEQKAIFEMFRQGSNRDTWKAGGSGIGLSVCKLIMNSHRGGITVSSIPGQGSRFTVTFPAQRTES